LAIKLIFGTGDGSHHKQHDLDQVLRALTGCTYELEKKALLNGYVYTVNVLSPNEEYTRLVEEFEGTDPETGEKWGEWDIGIT